MSDDKIYRAIEKLRDPNRLAFLETEKIVNLCLEGITPRTILDVGTGSGIFAEAFFRLGLDVTGVDIQEPMLEAAKIMFPVQPSNWPRRKACLSRTRPSTLFFWVWCSMNQSTPYRRFRNRAGFAPFGPGYWNGLTGKRVSDRP